MNVRDIVWRIKGFSTPFGGIDWEAPVPQKTVARKLVLYLEDRRVLSANRAITDSVADPDHCVASVLRIREKLTDLLMDPDIGDRLAEHVGAMRAACRKFLDTVGRSGAVGGSGDRRGDATFAAALGELRAVFGIQLGVVAARYGLELPESLAAILPAPDVDDEYDRRPAV
jgi:hypothetical protein